MDKAPDAFRTISEVAEELDLPQHVLRFWETRFPQIKPMKRGGGRRYYRPDDVDLLRGIRYLLYGEGYTIRGVQRILKDHGGKFVQSVWLAGAPQPKRSAADREDADVVEAPRAKGRGDSLPTTPTATAAGAKTGNGEETRPTSRASAAAMREAAAANLIRQRVSSGGSGAAKGSPSSSRAEGDMHQLKAALEELSECRRLIDAALSDDQ